MVLRQSEVTIKNYEREKIAERSESPVSYTHLDVYKRQGVGGILVVLLIVALGGGAAFYICLLYTSQMLDRQP